MQIEADFVSDSFRHRWSGYSLGKIEFQFWFVRLAENDFEIRSRNRFREAGRCAVGISNRCTMARLARRHDDNR